MTLGKAVASASISLLWLADVLSTLLFGYTRALGDGPHDPWADILRLDAAFIGVAAAWLLTIVGTTFSQQPLVLRLVFCAMPTLVVIYIFFTAIAHT